MAGPLVLGIADSSFLVLPFGNDVLLTVLIARNHAWRGNTLRLRQQAQCSESPFLTFGGHPKAANEGQLKTGQ